MSSRRSTIAGVVFAAAGLTILGSHGPGVGAEGVNAKVPVSGKVGFISAPTANVSLLTADAATGAPGDSVSGQVSMTVESNKAYSVTVTPAATQLTSAGTTDTIAATALTTSDFSGSPANFGGPVEIVRTSAKSASPGGDTHTSALSMTIPWVEPGEYTISLDYAVAQR